MEEDIKILEEMRKDIVYDSDEDYDNQIAIRQIQAIENLIKGYREIGNQNRQYKIAYKLMEKEALQDRKEFIPKSKIKEKIEELDKQRIKMEKEDIGVGFTLGNDWSDLKAKIQVLQELIEEN